MNDINTNSIFNRHPKTTITIVVLLFSLIAVLSINWIAGRLFGLGKVVLYEAHPIYGYRLLPNQFVARNPHQTIQINNLGLRASENWDPISTINKTQHKPRILFIGDSVTYGGSYINNKDIFSEKIAQKLPQYQIGNAAVNGWGVDNVVTFIKDTPFLHADTYVLVFPEGDFYRGLTRIGGQPFWTRNPHFALEELWHYGIYKAHLKKTPNLHQREYIPEDRTQIATLAVQHLQSLIEYLHQHDKKVMVYISPSKTQVLNEGELDPILKKLFEEYHIPAVYLLHKLNNTNILVQKKLNIANTSTKTLPDNPSMWFHDEIHLSAEGHAAWAELILEDLRIQS